MSTLLVVVYFGAVMKAIVVPFGLEACKPRLPTVRELIEESWAAQGYECGGLAVQCMPRDWLVVTPKVSL